MRWWFAPLILAACGVDTDGTLFAEVNGESVVFTMSDDASVPEMLVVRCKVDGLLEDTWELSSDGLTFPITLGAVPAGATAVVTYAAPPSGSSCTATVAAVKRDDVMVIGPDWEATFDHP